MNPIRTIGRLACMLTGLAAALAAAVAGAPAAFAQPSPPPGPPGEVIRFGPMLVPHTVPAHPRCHHGGPGRVADHPDRGGGRDSGCHRGGAS